MKRVITAYEPQLKAAGYTVSELLDMQRSDALKIVSSIEGEKIRSQCTMNKDALRQMCAKWIEGEPNASDSAAYCAEALAEAPAAETEKGDA